MLVAIYCIIFLKMATYKVIQDIEAEDKLLGPFGLRQFVYLIIIAVTLFIGFKLFTVAWYLVLPLLPHTIFFAMLALPFGGEQPTETWLLAKIRFAMKPRIRIWDQSGIKELVTITAPKKIEKQLTKNMSEGEVRSRLEALANTIDSRGWAIKNVNVNVFSQPAYAGMPTNSDRLIDIGMSTQAGPANDITASDDMLDEQNNPTAQNLDRMISASSKAHRDQIVASMKLPDPTTVPIINDSAIHPFSKVTAPKKDDDSAQDDTAAAKPDYWFLNSNAGPTVPPPTPAPMTGTTPQPSNLVIPDPGAVQQSQGLPLAPVGQPVGPLTEEELLDKIHAEKEKSPKSYGHMRVIKTLEEQQAEAEAAARAAAEAATKAPPVTPAPDPDIIELARNDDLNVATVARQAKKSKDKELSEDGEVVINLH